MKQAESSRKPARTALLDLAVLRSWCGGLAISARRYE